MSYPTYVPTIGTGLADEIDDELARARAKHPSMPTEHHGLSVLREEIAELEAEVFKQQPYDHAAMRKEAIQIAATAIRFIQDLCRRT